MADKNQTKTKNQTMTAAAPNSTCNQDDDFQVEVDFSRRAYRLGTPIVGCIRVVAPDKQPVASLRLVAAGICRLDPRWQNANLYRTKFYHSHPSLGSNNESCELLDAQSVCFWATEPLELTALRERTILEWESAKPRPIRIKGLDNDDNATTYSTGSNDTPLHPCHAPPELPARNLAAEHECWSFAVDLPNCLPHSLTATSCRYSYHIFLRLERPNRPRDPIWLDYPVTVLSSASASNSSNPAAATGSRVQMAPPARALRHSNGLPTHVNPAEIYHRLPGRVMVNHESAALYQLTSSNNHSNNSNRYEPTTLRVADLQGRPVGVLTLLGVTHLTPSSRCIVKLDFPKPTNNNDSDNNIWTRCHQVCACLQGEEIATQATGQRKRARSYLLDAAREKVSAGTTSVCLELLVPLDAPCSVHTELVHIAVRCLIDLTVSPQSDSNSGTTQAYQNLRLEIPCHIGHGCTADEGDDQTYAAPLRRPDNYSLDPTDPASFPAVDVQTDLQPLAHTMARKCHLLPDPRPRACRQGS